MENKQFNARAVVEAGLMSAIIVVLMLMTIYVPILDMIGVYILPIPITILYMRHNLKVTIAGLVVSAAILSMVFDPIRGISLLIMFGLSGITLGYCFKKDKSPLVTIAILTLTLLVGVMVNVVMTALIIQRTSIINFITQSINTANEVTTQVTNSLRQTYTSVGAPKEVLDQLDKISVMTHINATLGSIGLIFISTAVFSAFMDYIAAKAILLRLGYNIKKMKQFTLLYINSLTGALIALPMALGMLLFGKKVPYGETILIIGQMLFQTTFLVIGISVVFYFLKNRFKLSKGLAIVIAIFTIFNPVFVQIYLFIGLADMIIDFRKINPNRVLRR